jgi:hypothetical protein
MISDPTSEEGKIYTTIASTVLSSLEKGINDNNDPPIILE